MKIREAKYDGDYRLIIEFVDGKTIEADFHDFIFGSFQPMTYQFKDKKLFSKVRVWNGILDWFNEMDFDSNELYDNLIPGIKIHEIHSI